METEEAIESLEVRLLLEAIHERYGYDLRGYARAPMRRRVVAALQAAGLPHLGELQHRLLHEPALFADVLADLTVPASAMFRDPELYRSIREHVAPILLTYPRVKVWHAGCATGEEVFSMAITLAEEGLYDRTTIFATDLSPRAIESAAQGVFDAAPLDAYSANYVAAGGRATLESYFTAAYDRIALVERIAHNICFFQHDLVSDHVFGEMNVVLCRNVLMYFDAPLRELVVMKLTQGLCPGGFLCLGMDERLPEACASSFAEVEGAPSLYRYVP